MSEESRDPTAASEASPRRNPLWLGLLVIAVLAGLRLSGLNADTPRSLSSWSLGLYVDEGYKTLDARNRVLFEEAKWHPEDDYAGWSEQSPLTQWAYELAFRTLGVELASARLVSVVCFVLLLVAYFLAHRRRHSTRCLLIALLFLGTQATLFFFSRIAIFEFPLMVFVYGALFALARNDRIRGAWLGILLGAAFAIATLGIKDSASLYFLPIGIGIFVSYFAPRNGGEARHVPLGAVLGLFALLALTLWFQRDWAIEKFGLSVPNYARVLFWSPMVYSAAPLATAGLACAVHALLVKPGRFLSDPYRASLLAMVLVGPLLLSILEYHPLRYYVPFFPAHVLVIVEWLQLRTWRAEPSRAIPRWGWLVLVPFLTWLFGYLQVAMLRHLLLPIEALTTRLLTLVTPNRVALLALVLALAVVLLRRRLFPGRAPVVLVMGLLLLGLVTDVRQVGSFLLHPTYRLRDINRNLERILPEGATIGGGWAPVLTVNTELRSLYMNLLINRPNHISLLRPDYLLVAGTSQYYRYIERRRDIRTGSPVFRSSYAGHEVLVVPLTYRQLPANATPPRTADEASSG